MDDRAPRASKGATLAPTYDGQQRGVREGARLDQRLRYVQAVHAAELDRIRALLAPLGRGVEVAAVSRVDGGLVNTVFRVVLESGEEVAVRLYRGGHRAYDTEREAIARLGTSVPVPEVLLSGSADRDSPTPFLVYRWIDGVTLNECRREAPPLEFLSLAEPLGRALATVATVAFSDFEREAAVHAGPTVPAALTLADERLRAGAARERLGEALAEPLRARLQAVRSRLVSSDTAAGLVHGDLRGRNILVSRTDTGRWRLSGLIDWEGAFSGSALWDVGALFRYGERFSPEFRARFERGYRTAGGALPDDWWHAAKLLDTTHLVAILNDEREMPELFAECRSLVAALARDR